MPKPAVVARLVATPGKREELLEALGALVAAAHDEPGTELYVMLRDSDEDTVWFWELYTDKAAADAHSTSDTMKSIGGKLGGLVAAAPEIRFLEPVKGKGLDLG
jgi:quinol monooxygenase YgiN